MTAEELAEDVLQDVRELHDGDEVEKQQRLATAVAGDVEQQQRRAWLIA